MESVTEFTLPVGINIAKTLTFITMEGMLSKGTGWKSQSGQGPCAKCYVGWPSSIFTVVPSKA